MFQLTISSFVDDIRKTRHISCRRNLFITKPMNSSCICVRNHSLKLVIQSRLIGVFLLSKYKWCYVWFVFRIITVSSFACFKTFIKFWKTKINVNLFLLPLNCRISHCFFYRKTQSSYYANIISFTFFFYLKKMWLVLSANKQSTYCFHMFYALIITLITLRFTHLLFINLLSI